MSSDDQKKDINLVSVDDGASSVVDPNLAEGLDGFGDFVETDSYKALEEAYTKGEISEEVFSEQREIKFREFMKSR